MICWETKNHLSLKFNITVDENELYFPKGFPIEVFLARGVETQDPLVIELGVHIASYLLSGRGFSFNGYEIRDTVDYLPWLAELRSLLLGGTTIPTRRFPRRAPRDRDGT